MEAVGQVPDTPAAMGRRGGQQSDPGGTRGSLVAAATSAVINKAPAFCP